MGVLTRIENWRRWVPVPTSDGGIQLGRWILLEGSRHAVTAVLLLVTFLATLGIGELWTFEMQRLLTETPAVQTVLNSFMGGIILLVSIVVSINSIVLSYDISHLSAQENQIEGTMQFQQEIGDLGNGTPADPTSFLLTMAEAITETAQELEALVDAENEEFVTDVEEYVESIVSTAEHLDTSLERTTGGEFGVLWVGLETDYGPLLNRSQALVTEYDTHLSDQARAQFEELMRVLKLFATGREYFKTLYYSGEVSELSRTLLLISLPSIIVTATTILAINAQLLPDLWLLGLPPLLTFVAIAFTVSLAPFIVLTAYMLRVATITRRAVARGPFVLQS